MYETSDESAALQRLLDESAAAGPHLRGIITDDRRISAAQLCRRLHGMCLLVLGTVTSDGRPLVGPLDGYLLHGSLFFSSGRSSVRVRHLKARPYVSASHLPDPRFPELRQAMLEGSGFRNVARGGGRDTGPDRRSEDVHVLVPAGFGMDLINPAAGDS